MSAPSFILFSDFNCPFCYALHERLHELGLIDRCAWQGVQHAPYLPVPIKPWTGSLSAELRHEVSVVKRISPGLPLEVPGGKPNTGHAIACAAELLERDRQEGMTLVRKIYHAFWAEGRDISDERVLAELAGSQPKPAGEGAAIAATWTAAWEATEEGSVPLLIAQNNDVLVGCVPAEEIRRFFADHS